MFLIHRALGLRARRPEAFEGGYTPLDAGPRAFAYARGDAVIAATPVAEGGAASDVAIPAELRGALAQRADRRDGGARRGRERRPPCGVLPGGSARTGVSASAGCRLVEVADGAAPTRGFPALVMYPADAPERTVALPPYTAEVAMDAPVAAGAHPLVVVSHGTGSWHMVHRALGAHLARNGFVVAMPVHPGDNREDATAVGTPDNLSERPRHLRVLADRLAADDLLGPHLPGTIAVIGHSMGGGTALALAGGRPTTFPHEEPDGVARPVAVEPDPRVAALVLLAPATAAFRMEGALDAVAVPVLMLTGERDQVTTARHAEIVATGLPDGAPLEHHVIARAGHNSFLSPYPEEMAGPRYPASLDPEGFDRHAFHGWMQAEIVRFLRRVL